MVNRPVVAVVGAGFSGLLTALHLLTAGDGPTVRLFERRGVFGRGLAYGTDNAEHLLNVRAANMSAFPDRPDHFTEWLAAHGGWRSQGGFVTRGAYGDYLQDMLREAMFGGAGGSRLLLEADGIDRIRRAGGGYRLTTSMGRSFDVDAVVLATGAPVPAALPGLDPELARSGRYIVDPWRPGGIPPDLGDHVLLIGSGLTMVDVVMANAAPYRRFTVISRRGLLPAEHGPNPPAAGAMRLTGSPLEVMRQLRQAARTRDWREVIDEARGSARTLWGSWSYAERRAFLRHLRPWWDVHRHRMSPAVARRLKAAEAAGAFVLHAGEPRALSLRGDQVRVDWRPRGARRTQRLYVDAVVNCTGRQGDVRHTEDALIRSLLAEGLARPDRCGLGLDVDEASRVLGPDGAAQPGLHAVGPLTRGAFWEITAVPDIREQARDVARDVLRSTHASHRQAGIA